MLHLRETKGLPQRLKPDQNGIAERARIKSVPFPKAESLPRLIFVWAHFVCYDGFERTSTIFVLCARDAATNRSRRIGIGAGTFPDDSLLIPWWVSSEPVNMRVRRSEFGVGKKFAVIFPVLRDSRESASEAGPALGFLYVRMI
jgi:hypothetical protein